MMSTRLLAACVTLLLCGAPIIARAGSGDPRLINGVIEWPAAVTNEPFVIVRGDDGVVYSVGIAAARREGAVTAGSRISVLGLEGRGPHEITAVGVGSGLSAEAAFAQLQGIRQPAAIAPVPTTPSVRPADVPSPKLPTDTRASAGAAAPAVVPASTSAPAVATAQPATFATAPMLVPSDEHRWVEITGEVETLAGRTLVLKVDGGRVSVDLSSLRANLERIVTPGSMVKFYGVPVELRFKAMGFIDPDARPHAPRSN